MRVFDHRIVTQIRTLLVRAWVDTSILDFGVTNGVVYFKGTFRHHLSKQNLNRTDRVKYNEVEMMKRMERSVRGIPGVRDMIFRLDNMFKSGAQWKER